jgi:two-component system LytT family response regulator
MKTLSTIIVEDSLPQLERLQKLVEEHCPEARVVGTATNLTDAHELIVRQQPDLLLLDIEFNEGLTSFNLLDDLRTLNALHFPVIFFSAHAIEKNYAQIALNYAAFQCLQKPIDHRLLQEAIERVVVFIKGKNAEVIEAQYKAQYEVLLGLVKNRDFGNSPFFVRTLKGKLENINPDNVLYLKSDDKITRFKLQDGSEVVGMELIGYYTFLTEDPKFFRVHQSYIVNLSKVRSYDPKEKTLTLFNGEVVYASRQLNQDLRGYLGG